MEPRTYTYRASAPIMFMVIVFFGACAWVIAHQALNVEGPVRLKYIGRVSVEAVPYVLWTLTGVSLAFVLAGIFGLFRSFSGGGVILLDDNGIEAPRSQVSSRTRRLEWTRITAVKVIEMRGQVILSLTAGDRKLTIARSGLRPKGAFDELLAQVQTRMGQPGS